MKARENPKSPCTQAFQLNGRKNLTKVRSWWNAASPTYWANRKKKEV